MISRPRQEAATGASEPLVKEVTVPLSQAQAFALFTERTASWWPLVTHSVAGEDAVGCHFEPRVGGRLVETARDGTEHTWGTVLEWDPPARIALTWHPGRTPATEQHLEVTFVVQAAAETIVRLVHTGWERLSEGGGVERRNYDGGWDYVLGRFTDAAATAG